MINSLNPYPTVRASNLSWLGDVPAHWDLVPMFGAFSPNKESNIGMKLSQVLSLSYGRIIVKPLEKLRGLVPASFETYQVIRRGDIIIRTTDLQNDRTSLRIGIARDDGIITSAYLSLQPIGEVTPDFGFHYLQAWDTGKAIYGYGSGLRQSLAFDHFKRMPIPVPPQNEQQAIVKFLDHVDVRINRTIAAKRKTIALLNEQKQSIVHQAVTRGLDSSTPLKPSGIPWVGDIPAHWELKPNRALIRRRKVLVGERHPEFRLLSLTKQGVIVRNLTNMSGKFSADMGSSQEVRQRNLIFCLFDVPETPRTVGLAAVAGMITGAYTVFEAVGDCNMSFLELFYKAMDDRKLLSPLYSGLRNTIPTQRLLGIKTPQPPRDEQGAIVNFVEAESQRIEKAVLKLAKECDLLNEYRTRLVLDVVTGKLDVREAAKSLPDHVAVTDQSRENAMAMVTDDTEMADAE